MLDFQDLTLTQKIFSLVAIAAAYIAYAFFHFRSLQRKNQQFDIRYSAKPNFMTGNEVEFFHRLRSAVPELEVFPQVSQGALLETNLQPNDPNYWASRDAFSRRICDFVLCDKRSLKPALIVELDDVTHSADKDHERDKLTAKAGLRTLRFWSRSKATKSEIREAVIALAPNAFYNAS